MDKWENNIKNIGVFSRFKNGRDIDDLYDSLSPLTKLLLDAYINLVGKKNLIIIFPDYNLRVIPLLAYIYSKLKNKSTLIFSNDKRINFKSYKENHSHNYYLLNRKIQASRSYLFYDIPIFYLEKEKMLLDLYLPRANNSFKKYNMISLQKKLKNYFGPKILVNNEFNVTKIVNNVNEIICNRKVLNEDNKKIYLKLGNIIFENANTYLSYKNSCENFVNWIKENVDKNVNIILHFSDIKLNDLNYIKEELDCLVFPFNFNILNNNQALINQNKSYYDSLKKDNFIDLANRYNLDKKYLIRNKQNIHLFSEFIKIGNIDLYFNDILKSMNEVNINDLYNKKLFFKCKYLLYSFCNLAVNPNFFKFLTLDEYNHWRYFTFLEFNSVFYNNLKHEKTYNQFLLNGIISKLNNIFSEITKCKRFNNKEYSYERIGKNYKLLEIAKNKNEYFNKDLKLIICTLFDTEANIINNQLSDNNIINVKAVYIKNLIKLNINKSEYNLLIPGLLPQKFEFELYEPYNEIIFLSYEGKQKNLIENQINNICNPPIEEEKIYMSYLSEIYEFMNLSKNNLLFNDFNKRNEEYINNLDNENYKEYNDNWLESENKSNLNFVDYSNDLDSKTIMLYLRNIENDKCVIKNLPINKSYFSFKKDKMDKGNEISPSLLKKGDYIVILENDERKSLVDLILEIYDLNSEIDSNFIEYWKRQLLSYIDFEGITYKEFYNRYKLNNGERDYQTTRLWAKGNMIGPKDENDLYIIGETINDDYIKNNYKNMMKEIENIRKLHVQVGIRLRKIIKKIMLNKGIDDSYDLSYEEYFLYNSIKNGIYEVIEIHDD